MRLGRILSALVLLGGVAAAPPAEAGTTVTVSLGVPAPMVEVRPSRPDPNWVWIDGYWAHVHGHHWEWVPGYWYYAPPYRRVYHPVHHTYGHYVYVGDRWDWHEDRQEYWEDRHEAWEDRQEYWEDRREAEEDRREYLEDRREAQEDRREHDEDRREGNRGNGRGPKR